jgi:hypothetical protein
MVMTVLSTLWEPKADLLSTRYYHRLQLLDIVLTRRQVPRMNRLEIADKHGVRTESTQDFYERFRHAFLTEVREFTEACVFDKRKFYFEVHPEFIQRLMENLSTALPLSIEDAIEASKIGKNFLDN